MNDHMKGQCPLPYSLKCSYCQTRNIRSDQCPCRRTQNKRTAPNHIHTSKIKSETAIFVKVHGKTIRAKLNPSIQETTICRAVADLVKLHTDNVIRKTLIRKPGSFNLVKCIQMQIKSRNLVAEVDGVINENLPGKVIILGMRAISQLGYKFYVGGQEAKTRVEPSISTKPRKRTLKRKDHESNRKDNHPGRWSIRRQQKEDDSEDDDKLSFLDEEEERLIREWK